MNPLIPQPCLESLRASAHLRNQQGVLYAFLYTWVLFGLLQSICKGAILEQNRSNRIEGSTASDMHHVFVRQRLTMSGCGELLSV